VILPVLWYAVTYLGNPPGLKNQKGAYGLLFFLCWQLNLLAGAGCVRGHACILREAGVGIGNTVASAYGAVDKDTEAIVTYLRLIDAVVIAASVTATVIAIPVISSRAMVTVVAVSMVAVIPVPVVAVVSIAVVRECRNS
jgi:hypothetical protein